MSETFIEDCHWTSLTFFKQNGILNFGSLIVIIIQYLRRGIVSNFYCHSHSGEIPWLTESWIPKSKTTNKSFNNPTRRRRRSFGLLKLELGVLDFGIQDSVSHGISIPLWLYSRSYHMILFDSVIVAVSRVFLCNSKHKKLMHAQIVKCSHTGLINT